MPQRVDFTEINNPMLKFLLEDGTELRMKISLMSVTRTDRKLPDGQWEHEFKINQAIEQLAPEGEIDVRKLTGGTK